ncbi:Transient receptor potential cation channel subfamily V member 3 [Symbiodinium microadriaticum]|uniref:Transient receptor potential cation channel subfamily V member 3 n=1 Tax=Symbiodinium microadriaticum TaxID=2951 RepID=A0A1Q9F4I8_SYMMI|nr:Transient receptor potential cation channel subfamily V member 3 [Symbiodinium microadriaticum]
MTVDKALSFEVLWFWTIAKGPAQKGAFTNHANIWACEGSTVVMTAINANNVKGLQKALAAAPRGERATWLLHIQVGDQFISPFVWALENGSETICHAMLRDLLMIRADRSLYYYGADELFAKHQDVVKRLTDRTSALLRTLLDGLVWRSQRTEANGTLRRVNYFVKYVLEDAKGKFSPSLFFFRMFSYIVGMGRLLMLQLHRVWIWSRDTMRRIIADIDTDGNGEIDYEEMKEALSRFKDTVKGEIRKALKVLRNDEDLEEMNSDKKDLANQEKNTYNRISFTVMLMLVLMMFLEPMLLCANEPNWPTDDCSHVTPVSRYWYSVFGMIAMIVHWLLLIDMTIFSTQLSAFLLVVGHVLGEVKQFLIALTFLLLLFGSSISILCDRRCGDDGGDFNDMWNAIISLFSITVTLYQGDFREIQADPMLLAMIYLFLLVSVVLLLNLLIAQLNQTYEYINKDVLGFARLNRASLVVDAMASCPKSKWKKFIADLKLDEKREFDEGDLGLPGCIQSHEAAGLHRQSEEQIRRYGGSTLPSLPWPEDKVKKRGPAEDTPEARLAHIEYLLEKAVRRRHHLVGSSDSHSHDASGSSVGSSAGSSLSGSSINDSEDSEG